MLTQRLENVINVSSKQIIRFIQFCIKRFYLFSEICFHDECFTKFTKYENKKNKKETTAYQAAVVAELLERNPFFGFIFRWRVVGNEFVNGL